MTEPKEKFQERRGSERVHIPAKFKVKARIRVLGLKETCYMSVVNMSMGGLSLSGADSISLDDARIGSQVEILLYHKHLSLKLMAEVLGAHKNGHEKKDTTDVRTKIIGIDAKSRELLGDFLKEFATRG